ncbi:probable polyketide synthase 1 [Mytilus edulis]|uniref:probable polyketide synthase 1 n=1 Tax=Mytilus edulis TaxID=6550 RepID=UPI0039F04B2E
MNKDMSLGLNEAAHEYNNSLVTGMASSIISNRLSYFLDIRGPSLTIDTACSSALVAIHLGCQAIRSGDCSMAICGGVNSVLTPINYMALSKASMTSKTGKCRTFSRDADGYARGEGCGIVVIKSRKQAQNDGDKILGVVMSGCNQDGKENTPITAPSGNQQKELLKRVYSSHKINPADIQYIESHGTGTPIGDPTETNALADFFSSFLPEDKKIPIGSVKTNIGHLESSAGTAGLIKVLLMMKHSTIVPSLHYSKENSNPKIDFNKIPLEVSTSLRPWKERPDGSRLSCVNSFGFGGSNSHVIIKQLPQTYTSEIYHPCNETMVDCMIALSATSQEALLSTTEHFIQKIESESYNIQELSFTSLIKRSHYRYRFAVIANNMNNLKEKLKCFPTTDEMSKKIKPVQLTFIFCGVGTVWKGMCQGFLTNNKVFKDTVIEIDDELGKYTKISILDTLNNPSSSFLKDPFLGPLGIFTCQMGILNMWRDTGVSPDLIIGQSVGEVAAAYAAGCLTLTEAVRVTYYRSLLSSKSAGGKMVVVGNSNIGKIEEICKASGNKLAVAVYSSNETCVVSGDEHSIQDLKDIVFSKNEFSSVLLKELDVTCAYHSHHMTEASQQLKTELKSLKGGAPNVPIVSTVSGKQVNGPEMGTAEYWSANLLKPVLLRDAVKEAINPGKNNIFIEIGPKPILRPHLKNITNEMAMVIPSSNYPDECDTFMKAISEIYMHNVSIKFDKLCMLQQRLTDIPRYKFHRSGKLLISKTLRASLQANVIKGNTHPFVTRNPLSDGFRVTLSKEKTSYIYEHELDKQHIAPGAIYAEIGLVVLKTHSSYPLSDISISLHFVKPLGVSQNLPVELEVSVSTTNCTFDVKRKNDMICEGKYFRTKTPDLVQINIDEIKQSCQTYVTKKLFYETLSKLGFEYGQSLKLIGDSWRSDTEYIATMNVPDEVVNAMHSMHLHPCILDGVLQTLSISWISVIEKYKYLDDEVSRPIPIRLGALTLRKSPRSKMFIHGKLMQSSIQHAFLNILLLTESGEVVATIESYEVKNVAPSFSILSLSDKTYGVRWSYVKVEHLNIPEGNLQNTLFICLTVASYKSSKLIQVDDTSLAILFDVTSNDSNKLLNYIELALNAKSMKWSSISDIVYFPGFKHADNNLNTNIIYKCTRDSCLILLKLLQILIEKAIEIPIYVITENTQAHIGEEEGALYNVAGSELWGMGRCIVRERTYSNLKLVDLTEESSIERLPLIIENSRENGILRNTPEIKCFDHGIYMNQIVRLLADNFQGYRLSLYNPQQQLELRSKDFKTMADPFFVENVTQRKFDETRHEIINVKRAIVIPHMSPITTTMAIDDQDPWKNTRDNGHPIIATEYFGKIASKTKTNSYSAINQEPSNIHSESNPDSNNMDVIGCYPSIVSNYVCVPKSCLIPLEEFNNQYRPGLMHECILYISVLVELNEKVPIGILYDKSLGLDIHILKSFLEMAQYKVAYLLNVVDFPDECDLNKDCQIVLFVDNMTCISECIAKVCDVTPKIIALSNFINKSKERVLRHTCSLSNSEICIINYDEIMSEPRLGKLVKALRSFLSKSCKIEKTPGVSDKISIVNFDDRNQEENAINASDRDVKIDISRIFNKSSGYLIIGGLTGLGWEIVKLIAEMGGGCISIIARSTPTEEQLSQMKSVMKKHGCHIISLIGDVTDYMSLKGALDQYKDEFPIYPLKGVFHGAAVVDDALIVYMKEEQFEKVLRPKILGTLNLHNLTRDMNLDYFVMHSSITSVFGNSGQTNYGAGNAFMDTFAFYRRSKGLCGQTINWGALHLGLLTTSERVELHLNSQGYISLKRDEIIECLLHTLCKNFTQIVYGIFNWETIIRQSPDMKHLHSKIQPLLTELNLKDIFTSKQGNKINVDVDEILKLPEEKRYAKTVEALGEIVADAFAIELTDINEMTFFVDLGIDSMKGMSLINNIYTYFICKIPIVAVLEQDANINTIARIIVKQMEVALLQQ